MTATSTAPTIIHKPMRTSPGETSSPGQTSSTTTSPMSEVITPTHIAHDMRSSTLPAHLSEVLKVEGKMGMGDQRLSGFSQNNTVADMPGVSSSTTQELASPPPEEAEENVSSSAATAVRETCEKQMNEHLPPPSTIAASGLVSGTQPQPHAAPCARTAAGVDRLSPLQKTVQLLEQYLSAESVQRCTCAASQVEGMDTPTEPPSSSSFADSAECLDAVRPVIPFLDSRVTVPLLALLQIAPLMDAVHAGLDEATAVAAKVTTTMALADRRRCEDVSSSAGVTSRHTVLQQVCYLLEALKLSKHLLLRDDLPSTGPEPAILLPVDACELRQFRVGPASHAALGVRCTLLLECASEDAAAVQCLETLCRTRLRTVVEADLATCVVVCCMEGPTHCLAVTFTTRQMACEAFTQLQSCAPYKAGLLTVRMRVENHPRTVAGGASMAVPAMLSSPHAASYHSGNLGAVGAGQRRWMPPAQKSGVALSRALAIASAAATDGAEPSSPLPRTSGQPPRATSQKIDALGSRPATSQRTPLTASPRSSTRHTLAPAPIDDDDHTRPAPAAREDATKAVHHNGLNLEAAPFVPRSLRGLGGSEEDLPLAFAQAAFMPGASQPLTASAPALLSRESEALATQTTSTHRIGEAQSKTSAKPAASSSCAASPAVTLAPVGALDVAETGFARETRSYPRGSTGAASRVVSVQPHAIGDEQTPPTESLAAQSCASLSPPRAGLYRSSSSLPQPPAALIGDEPASFSDSQAPSSSSRRWRRNDPYSFSAATVETSAPSSPAQSLHSEYQRSPLHRVALLTPGSRLTPTFVDPGSRMKERTSRLSTAFNSAAVSTDAVVEIPGEVVSAGAVSHAPFADPRKTSKRILTYAEVLQQERPRSGMSSDH